MSSEDIPGEVLLCTFYITTAHLLLQLEKLKKLLMAHDAKQLYLIRLTFFYETLSKQAMRNVASFGFKIITKYDRTSFPQGLHYKCLFNAEDLQKTT